MTATVLDGVVADRATGTQVELLMTAVPWTILLGACLVERMLNRSR